MTFASAVGNLPIEDYAMIGDCRSAALVSRAGSIDWLCWPRFDSPAIFCALLDSQRGGMFGVRPQAAFHAKREYVGETAVLQTTFTTDDGEFTLTDAMPIATPEEQRRMLMPEHEIVRVLTCTKGEGSIEVRFEPRTGFGQWNDKLRDRGKLGLRVETRQGLLTLRCDLDLALDADGRSATGAKTLHRGESLHCSLTWTADAPAVLAPLGAMTHEKLARTLDAWRIWSARTTYAGPYEMLVRRSAITVRLLSFAPSGAIVAAATSSLPEVRGGKNNWDYRYCWLRDAAFTVRGMLELGHPEEAQGFGHWLLHATQLTQPKLKVLYDVYGREPPREMTVPGLSGYQGASPVQTGNGADDQIQLDCYGEVIDAVWRITLAGDKLTRAACGVMESFGLYVCKHWRTPDAGIWEPRGGSKQHTHSMALCWTALDRLIDLQDRGLMRKRRRALFERARDEIHREVYSRGYNEALGSYVSELDGDRLDATALLLGWYGFDAPDSARMRSTFVLLMSELSPAPGLLFRNKEAGDDGAFGICCFWLAEHLARGGGTLAEARAAFEATAAYANDVGLLSEEIEPGTGHALGNMPQNFTHVGLINAALSIAERATKEGVSP